MMRASEFITETASVGATSSGSVATVAAPMGGTISRIGGNFFTGAKYSNDAAPNTPAYMKKSKGKRRAK
jgi:hypothetical protein